jgi:hypothetical protein
MNNRIKWYDQILKINRQNPKAHVEHQTKKTPNNNIATITQIRTYNMGNYGGALGKEKQLDKCGYCDTLCPFTATYLFCCIAHGHMFTTVHPKNVNVLLKINFHALCACGGYFILLLLEFIRPWKHIHVLH